MNFLTRKISTQTNFYPPQENRVPILNLTIQKFLVSKHQMMKIKQKTGEKELLIYRIEKKLSTTS